jgi:hypothetical protein
MLRQASGVAQNIESPGWRFEDLCKLLFVRFGNYRNVMNRLCPRWIVIEYNDLSIPVFDQLVQVTVDNCLAWGRPD